MLEIPKFSPFDHTATDDFKKEWTASYIEYEPHWSHYHNVHTLGHYADFNDTPKEKLLIFARDLYSRKYNDIPLFVSDMVQRVFSMEERWLIHPSFHPATTPHMQRPDDNDARLIYLMSNKHLAIFHDPTYVSELAIYFQHQSVTPHNLALLFALCESPQDLLKRLDTLFTEYPILFEKLVPSTNRTFWHKHSKEISNFNIETHPYAAYLSLNFIKAPYNIPKEKMHTLHQKFPHTVYPPTASLAWFVGGKQEHAVILRSFLEYYKPDSLRFLIEEKYPTESQLLNAVGNIFIENMIEFLTCKTIPQEECSLQF